MFTPEYWKKIIDKDKKWHRRFLDLAKLVSTWSRDPSTQCGAVIIRPNFTICSVGFNGFPQKMSDDSNLYQIRELKYSRIVHCEMNAILFAKENLSGYILATYPFLSCERCSVHIIQCGINRCIAPLPTPAIQERWGESLKKSRQYFEEAGVQVSEIEYEPNI